MGAFDDMVRWLQTPEARAAARSELHRRGLAVLDPDDLINDVVLRLARAELPAELANPVGYARRALTLRAMDLLRGARVERRHVVAVHGHDDDGDEDRLVELPDPAPLDPSAEAALADVEDELRRALHRRLAVVRVKVWAVAAALTTLTLRVHRDVAIPDTAPEPEVGSTAKADRWAALWLAGEHEAFPDEAVGRTDGVALRKARSRKLQEVERLLLDVALDVLGTDLDG
jgi:DNA-directed RNA polymerase specialized sigma24 family protein